MAVRDITYVGEGLIPAPLDGLALRYALLPKDAVTDIAVHHWTGWTPPETWTADEEIAYILRIDQYHRTGRGLDGIGYQLAPFPSGRVYVVSRLDRYGAHVGHENAHLIGIGLPGTFHIKTPAPKHLEATARAVGYIYDYLGRDVPTRPHLAWGGTNCPGDRWPEWVPQLRVQALQEDDMDQETFNQMARKFMLEYPMFPRDDEGNRWHTTQRPMVNWLYQLRDLIDKNQKAIAQRLKRGDKVELK